MSGDDRRRGRRVLAAAVLALTLGALGLVSLNAVLFGELVDEVSQAQSRASALGKSDREILVLRQRITELGAGSSPQAVLVQTGLLDRQLGVSVIALPEDAERRVNRLRNDAEQLFYLRTIESLEHFARPLPFAEVPGNLARQELVG